MQLERGFDTKGVVEVHGAALLRFLRNREHVRAETDLAFDRRLNRFVEPGGALLAGLIPTLAPRPLDHAPTLA